MREYLSFEEAREYVRKLNLGTYLNWVDYIKSGNRPDNIPVSADNYYKNKGWCGWVDFLGSKNKKRNRKFLSYKEAKDYAIKLGIRSKRDWEQYFKENEKPINIPCDPHKTYKLTGEWISWGEFLNTGSVNLSNKYKKYTYEEYKKIINDFGIIRKGDLFDYIRNNKLEDELSIKPYETYKRSGWIDWESLFENPNYLSYNDAKKYLYKFNIKTKDEYLEFIDNGVIDNIVPRYPKEYYKNSGWVSFIDYVSGGYNYLPFEEAREYVWELNLLLPINWINYCNSSDKPDNIPSNPDKIYKNDGWSGWDNWLFGYEGYYICYDEAREFASKLNLKVKNDWDIARKENKIPYNIPKYPETYYKKTGEWENWGLFLENRGAIGYDFMSFDEACDYVRRLDLKTSRDWNKYKASPDKPTNLPAHPNRVYLSEWISWPHFLCYKFPNPNLMFAYCLQNGIDSAEKYHEHWLKNPGCGLPYNPVSYYKLREVEKI